MTKEEQMKAREDLDKVLKEQFYMTLRALEHCDELTLGTGTETSLLNYLQALSQELGVPNYPSAFLPANWDGFSFVQLDGEEPVKDEPKEETRFKIEPVVAIEDVVAAEAEAIFGTTGEPAAEAEEPAPSYTKQEVVNILTGLNKKYGDEAEIIPTALSKFGCSKLSEVPAEKYGELIAVAKEIAGES